MAWRIPEGVGLPRHAQGVRASAAVDWRKVDDTMRFSELVRILESCGFRLLKEKGSVRYYRKAGHDRLIRVDFHGSKEVPAGTCHALLKAAGIKPGVNDD